eukprot:5370006-Amphidinium_carterae.1
MALPGWKEHSLVDAVRVEGFDAVIQIGFAHTDQMLRTLSINTLPPESRVNGYVAQWQSGLLQMVQNRACPAFLPF